ncbi:MAG: ferredoxin [Minisyncoccia bacterium]
MTTKLALKVNTQKCIGCGMCVNLCPEVFELKNGRSSVKKDAKIEKNKDCIIQAEQNCPMGAIEFKEK